MGSEDDEIGEIYICIDGQNVSLHKELKIVGLLSILKQLKKLSDCSGLKIRVETVCPPWSIKEHSEEIRKFSRLISLLIWNQDKEIDDYIVVSLASSNDGYYISADKKMHDQIGKSDDWMKAHRIGWKPMNKKKISKQLLEDGGLPMMLTQLQIPSGKLADIYAEMKKEGELDIELEHWEREILNNNLKITQKVVKETSEPNAEKRSSIPNLTSSNSGMRLPISPKETAEAMVWLAKNSTKFDDLNSQREALKEAGILSRRVSAMRIQTIVARSVRDSSLDEKTGKLFFEGPDLHEIDIPIEGLETICDDIVRQTLDLGPIGSKAQIPRDQLEMYFIEVKKELRRMIEG